MDEALRAAGGCDGGRAGKIGAWFAARGVQVALVRPDRFVFAAGGVADVPEIARWAEGTFLGAAPIESARSRESALAAG